MQHSVAYDSRRIAAASKWDSSSMQTIALLTVVFLPAATVAAIFSLLARFATGSGVNVAVTARFWTYWAVCIPLTLLVIVIWYVWLQRTKIKYALEDEGTGADDEGSISRSTREK